MWDEAGGRASDSAHPWKGVGRHLLVAVEDVNMLVLTGRSMR